MIDGLDPFGEVSWYRPDACANRSRPWRRADMFVVTRVQSQDAL